MVVVVVSVVALEVSFTGTSGDATAAGVGLLSLFETAAVASVLVDETEGADSVV